VVGLNHIEKTAGHEQTDIEQKERKETKNSNASTH
jgi:hypothetical protein